EIDHKTVIEIEKIKSKKALESLLGKKVGDVVTLNTKGLFKEDYLLGSSLGIDGEKSEKLDIEVTFTIEEINEKEPAKLDQELDHKTVIENEKIKSKKALESLLGKKVGDVVTLNTKGLFKEDYLLGSSLGIDGEKSEKLDIEVTFTIEEINEKEPAKLDQE